MMKTGAKNAKHMLISLSASAKRRKSEKLSFHH
jgi:hypothetical protein